MELLIGIAGAVALVVWVIRRRERPTREPWEPEDSGIDYDELEAAEREVRDQNASALSEDDDLSDDWGPGAPRPPAA